MDRHNVAKPSLKQNFWTASTSTVRKCKKTHETRYFRGVTQTSEPATRNSADIDQNRKTSNSQLTMNSVASWSPEIANQGHVDMTNHSVSADRLPYVSYPQMQDLSKTANFNTQRPRQYHGTMIRADARMVTNDIRPSSETVQYRGVVQYRGMRSVSNHHPVEQKTAITYLQQGMTSVNHEPKKNYLKSMALSVRYPTTGSPVPRPPLPPYIPSGSINFTAGQRSSITSTRAMKRGVPTSTQGSKFGCVIGFVQVINVTVIC